MRKYTKFFVTSFISITTAFSFSFNGLLAKASNVEERASLKSVESHSLDNKGLNEIIIPECLCLDKEKSDKISSRLYKEETSLDSILFANKDGSETIYIFDENVKYKNIDDEIVDKSNKLYTDIENKTFSKDYLYVNKDNDIRTYFPEYLKYDVGVAVEAYGHAIEMYPVSKMTSKVIADDDLYGVHYDQVFGENTEVSYKPKFSGFKEDIILKKNVGNKFSFILETGDLVPVLEDGTILFQNDDGKSFGSISPTYVYDSYTDEQPVEKEQHFTLDNKYVLKRISEGKYTLDIIVDNAFLNNPSTVYPVIVDPSITINTTGSGSTKSILDTPIYNGSGVVGSAGANSLAILGYVNSTYGSGRLLMRFPGLMNKSFMSNPNYHIDSAIVYLNEVSGYSAGAFVTAYYYMGGSWSESSTYSSSLWNGIYKKDGVEQALMTDYFSYPNNTLGDFNITQAVRLWQSNHSYGSKGIIFKNKTSESSSSYAKTFYTTEGSTKPYLSVTYSNRSVYGNAFWGHGTSSKNFSIKLIGSLSTNSTWLPLINASCSSWNNSNAHTNITANASSSSNISLEVGYYDKDEYGQPISWYGLTSPSSGNSFSIKINTKTLNGKSSNFRKSTITHEIGHLLWLNDYSSSPPNDFSLMYHGRDRDKIYTPQYIDVFHVNTKY
jgi:hypothetical protein